jgi:CBS domain-containing protein
MPRYVPTVHDYMTPVPIVAAPHDAVSGALAAMHEHEVGHLPVVKGGVPAGIVSKRQLALASEHGDGRVGVDQVMTHAALVVAASAPLTKVAREMIANATDAVVVMDGKAIAGIFTTTDALCALIETIEGKQTLPLEEEAMREAPRGRTRPSAHPRAL